MWAYLLRCRLQKRPHFFFFKKVPTLPNFFGVVTLNKHILLFGPTKHAKNLKKNGWTDLCRINPGPRIDQFTSHAQIYVTEKCSYFCLHKIDKRIYIQA